MICKHCGVDFQGSKSEFANHVRWCDKNPKIQQTRKENSERILALQDKRFGEYKEFDAVCEKCFTSFKVTEREKLHPSRKRYFCSRACANSMGGQAKAEKHHPDEVATYITVAWRHHQKKCVACGEENVVAVHHMDGNHKNNDPKNLVPLCPTHHQYMHSKFKSLIIEKVNKYIEDKWG